MLWRGKLVMNFSFYSWKNDDDFFISGAEKINQFFISGEEKSRGVAEQEFRREVDWKEAGEERSDERARILSDNTSGTNEVG